MMAITFDTLKLAQKLRDKAKYTAEQAESLSSVLSETLSEWSELQEVATKSDLRELELKLENKIETVKADLTKWMFTGFVTVIGLSAAILFKLH